MVYILHDLHMKTSFFFQLQPKIKELYQAEKENNITAQVAAWISLIFKTILFSTDLYWWRTENKNTVVISNYSILLMLFKRNNIFKSSLIQRYNYDLRQTF